MTKFDQSKSKSGRIDVISGSMFSGKTEELLRRVRRAQIAKLNCLLVKPNSDKRFSENHITSHDQNKLEALSIQQSKDVIQYSETVDVIAIDEAQFFDNDLPEVCSELANKGKRVIVAGLDMDSFGKPFGPMPFLMARAEQVLKLSAICMNCGQDAAFSKRLSESIEQFELGAGNEYKPLCRTCFNA
jgi:thymidine kinase